mmetsp:Transcript_11959/g.23271  ORF Transcript_11959/g.23271 Transcript_11959/m.23271 type:complete len:144 (-) Transcript_11959:703-1134(-)
MCGGDEYLFMGTCCCYNAVTIKNVLLGCVNEDEVLCCFFSSCLALNTSAYSTGCGCNEGPYFIKAGIPCCSCGLKVPKVCCKGEAKCCCFRNACAFPFQSPVPEPVCAICFCRLLPGKVGFMKSPPLGIGAGLGAPPSSEMER